MRGMSRLRENPVAMQVSSNNRVHLNVRPCGPLRTCAVIVAAGVLLAGCGLRGPLVNPKEDLFDQMSAAPAGGPPAPETTATADSGQGKPAGAAPKPHKGFILDDLIR
jgi:predicted small lipoprotein YifL